MELRALANGGGGTNFTYIIPTAWFFASGAAPSSRPYADAASWLRSGPEGFGLGFEVDSGSGIGRTSAPTGTRRSTLPMTNRSGAPARDGDTKRPSLRKRSINRRSHGRKTGWGSEKKFRNVQIK